MGENRGQAGDEIGVGGRVALRCTVGRRGGNQSGADRAAEVWGAPDDKGGRPWTEEEHELFLKGMKQYERGDWKSISRKAMHTRNPTQFASHA
ncbi:transcription factor divaricata [Phtheirospermum japonicum]|uniref:Transcription factor divaricata n=1 Tax=Phtheirospermum japonicum TaxID=374723 RepID=A0A830D7Z6_9LAMI|nr:transcription factor divaricata [Phtheirospermum japonicum]